MATRSCMNLNWIFLVELEVRINPLLLHVRSVIRMTFACRRVQHLCHTYL